MNVWLFILLLMVGTNCNCPVGEYDDNGVCEECDKTCYECDGYKPNDCTSCSQASHRELISKRCRPISGYYENGEHVAGSCTPDHCDLCTSDDPDKCDNCIDGYFDKNDGLCYQCASQCTLCTNTHDLCTQCATGYALDYLYYCKSCSYWKSNCIQCSDNVTCTLCEDNYYVSGGSCNSCPDDCSACESASNCTECIDAQTYYLEDGGCEECPSNCTSCEGETECGGCVDEHHYLEGGVCWECPDNCTTCLSDTHCTECINSSYVLEGHVCVDRCGDDFAMTLPCDLPLGHELDGCTDDCQVEPDFECSIKPSLKTVCSFTGVLQASLLGTQKEMFANNITVQWQLTPKLYAFKSATPAALLSLNDSRFEQQHFSFDWSSGTVSCTFANSADVEGVRYSLSFAASASSNEQFYATTDHEWDFQVTTEPHLRAYNYPESVYTYSSFIFYFGYLVLALGLLSCLAGLFSPTRLAGLEAAFVLQYAFISLLWFSSYLYLPYYCLSPLQFSPGYGVFIFKESGLAEVVQIHF